MNNYTFGEKKTEFSKGKDIPVIWHNRYRTAKQKAIELIESGKYGLNESDFWILMNETKTGKMQYSGLIISHNGCLKINDCLPDNDKFKPECMSLDKDGYGDSLVYSYCCPEQGLFEVGEVSKANCKNAYPYAMALKRCFDRVVLKNSKIAYNNIYSESESDEFKNNYEEIPPSSVSTLGFNIPCQGCGKIVTPQEHDWSIKHFKGAILCRNCQIKASKP